VVGRQFRDVFGGGKIRGDLFVPDLRVLQETVFIHVVGMALDFKYRHDHLVSFGTFSVHINESARAGIGALLASVAQLELDLVMPSLWQFHEAAGCAVHPAVLAIHAHAAGEAPLRFFDRVLIG
jgi:hypothetical protein